MNTYHIVYLQGRSNGDAHTFGVCIFNDVTRAKRTIGCFHGGFHWKTAVKLYKPVASQAFPLLALPPFLVGKQKREQQKRVYCCIIGKPINQTTLHINSN